MTETPTVSVVIPAYNAAATLGIQLDALIAQEGAPRFEVVIANNRSTDRTADIAQSFSDRLDIRVVPAFDRQGVNCARNAGIAAAAADLVMLVDADDAVRPGAMRELYAAISADSEIGIAGGMLSSHDPDTYEIETPQRYLPYVPGGFMLLRREVFDATGGFDEAFVGGHDEVDFCWRAQHEGFKVILVKSALLDRVERPTSRGAFRQFKRYGFTYIQLWAKHRERGITGGTLRGEVRAARNLLRALPEFLSGPPERKLDAARMIGWTIGRWQGDLHFRVWGPR
ncbi:glycosyltransferase [Brachybacterium sp. DNPG3]